MEIMLPFFFDQIKAARNEKKMRLFTREYNIRIPIS